MRPADTSPEAWQTLLEIFRNMAPEEKLRRTLDMSDFLRSVCRAGIRAEYPNASEREVFLRATRRALGNELFAKVYGDVLRNE